MTVTGLQPTTSRQAPAYNLTVQGIPSYHIGHTQILVHNCPAGDGDLSGKTGNVSPDAFTHEWNYLPRIRKRGVEDPKSHNYPYSFDDIILQEKPLVKRLIAFEGVGGV